MRVVVDTNVWISGLIVPESPPGLALRAVLKGAFDVVISWELAAELRDVLGRPKLRRYSIAKEDVRDLLGLIAPDLPTVDVGVELRDPDDAPVIAAAVAGNADAIVTGDRHLLDDVGLRAWLSEHGVALLTPAELVQGLSTRGRQDLVD